MTFKELTATQGIPANDTPGNLAMAAPVTGQSMTLPACAPSKANGPAE